MLVITLGDPHSINIEMIAGPLAFGAFASHGTVIVGSAWHWQDQLARLGFTAQMPQCQVFKEWDALLKATSHRPPEGLLLLDVGGKQERAELLSAFERGQIAIDSLNALQALKKHGSDSGKGRLAVITGPIDKHACHAAGFKFGGQTEFFEDLWQKMAVMTLAGPQLRVGLVTNHVAVADLPAWLTTTLVTKKLELFIATLRTSFGIARPKVAVCGFNPHASDGGLFGTEEDRILKPAIAAVALAAGDQCVISGPLPADTVFYRAFHGAYDGVLAMYHDQGLGPLKTVHFDDAVNLSGGLPHLRVSPDHGPAADLFMTGRASGRSWQACFSLAERYLNEGRQMPLASGR